MDHAGPLFLGFDVGTQSTKALVVDAARQAVVARSSCPLELIGGLGPGHLEQHPQQWLAAIEATARAVLREVPAAQIAGIGVSGQQHGCVVLDGDGEVVRPAKLWCDTATAAEARELSQRLGRPVPTGFTASKLLWIARHEPANWARVRSVLLPHDYVNRWLTGAASMEYGDASGTGFFDPVARAFDPVARHVLPPGGGDRQAQARVRRGVRAAGSGRDRDLAGHLVERAGALGILRALPVHDVLELGMAGHVRCRSGDVLPASCER